MITIKMANHISAKDLWHEMAREDRPKFSSSNAPFVNLEHKVATKWVDVGASIYSGMNYQRIKEEITRILEDLDHVSHGWRYACRAGFKEGHQHDLNYYRHELIFQDKGEALMFKLRHP